LKALLVADKAEMRELLSFQITSVHPIVIKEANNAKEAVELLKKSENEYELLIAPYNGSDSVMIKHLKERKDNLPVIFFFDPTVLSPDQDSTQGVYSLAMIDQSKIVESIGGVLQAFLQERGSMDQLSEYCPIRTTLLIKATPLKSDIFIRLSEGKFVKLFASGDEFNQGDLEKYYNEKKVEYLYLKRGETAEFLQKFKKELEDLLAREDLPKEEAIQATEMSQETIHELVHKVGFTEEVQEIARKNVQLTVKTIGSHPKLKDVLARLAGAENYLSKHSNILAHVTCCIAKEMEWGSDSTFSKLVLASFMHDISLEDSELAKVNTLKELNEKAAQFSDALVKSYHLHPAKAADLIRSIKEIPADVDLIVIQHHELPNGSGFPRGLSHNYIAPLSALFIISHDLTQRILDQKQNFRLADFITEKKPFYSQGNFKKVMTAMEKIKL